MIINLLKNVWQEEVASYRYGKHVVAAVLLLGSCYGGYHVYTWHRANQERAAQAVLAEAIDEFDKALFYLVDGTHQNVQLAQQFFKDAELAFNVAATSHKDSNYLPYVYAFQADIQLRQGNKEKALELLDTSIKAFAKSHPLHDLMSIKKALVLLDTGDAQQGVTQLEALAAGKGMHADTAAFYLGYYYLVTGKENDCVRVWTALREAMRTTTMKAGRSAWLAIVEEKLQQLGEH